MFSFGLSSVFSIVFCCSFEHVFVCWETYRITIVALRILEILDSASKKLNLTTETLKKDVKSVKS